MSPTTKPFNGAVRCEWFQSPTQVTFTFYVRDRQEDDVRVQATDRSLTVTILLDPSGREYQYNVDHFYAPVTPDAAVINVRPMKIEISLKKASEMQWPALEALGNEAPKLAAPSLTDSSSNAAAVATNSSVPSKELKYPNSRGKDWSAVKIDDDDVKPEGEQALNALFQQIYGNGTDEQRRAMMKSFVESNGTVLSTNWDDVGKREVKMEPPTGMEPKPYTS
ncbi:putative phosphatase-like protein [Trypanosoma theileri]|uniref:Putative phosphatase-like protein n=1 Tax=Trypanosoma theileri TaxID=67003 RepID=A0A1X0NW51_9TRYP|nr:putative phosphatase-like protein [Trypanosoma theileri]ORC88917.1 putative phosphatase-like protein [Trypanosoma theileri]